MLFFIILLCIVACYTNVEVCEARTTLPRNTIRRMIVVVLRLCSVFLAEPLANRFFFVVLRTFDCDWLVRISGKKREAEAERTRGLLFQAYFTALFALPEVNFYLLVFLHRHQVRY